MDNRWLGMFTEQAKLRTIYHKRTINDLTLGTTVDTMLYSDGDLCLPDQDAFPLDPDVAELFTKYMVSTIAFENSIPSFMIMISTM
jgi:hypothetical protein